MDYDDDVGGAGGDDWDGDDGGSVGGGGGSVGAPGAPRTTRACEACRRLKARCLGDGVSPCSSCVRKGVDCVYAAHKKRGPKGGVLAALRAELEQLRAAVGAQQQQQQQHTNSQRADTAAAAAAGAAASRKRQRAERDDAPPPAAHLPPPPTAGRRGSASASSSSSSSGAAAPRVPHPHAPSFVSPEDEPRVAPMATEVRWMRIFLLFANQQLPLVCREMQYYDLLRMRCFEYAAAMMGPRRPVCNHAAGVCSVLTSMPVLPGVPPDVTSSSSSSGGGGGSGSASVAAAGGEGGGSQQHDDEESASFARAGSAASLTGILVAAAAAAGAQEAAAAGGTFGAASGGGNRGRVGSASSAATAGSGGGRGGSRGGGSSSSWSGASSTNGAAAAASGVLSLRHPVVRMATALATGTGALMSVTPAFIDAHLAQLPPGHAAPGFNTLPALQAAKAVHYGLLAVAARMDGAHECGDVYIGRCRSALGDAWDEPCPQTVSALLLLAFYSFGCVSLAVRDLRRPLLYMAHAAAIAEQLWLDGVAPPSPDGAGGGGGGGSAAAPSLHEMMHAPPRQGTAQVMAGAGMGGYVAAHMTSGGQRMTVYTAEQTPQRAGSAGAGQLPRPQVQAAPRRH
jgi:hypothetical protein